MSSELFEALNLLEKERGIQVDFMVDKITKAILTACKNSYDNEDARVEVNPDKGAFDVYLRKEVVDEVFEPNKEISLEDAQKINPNATYEDKVEVQLNTKEFGRIAAQTARNMIRQGIRDGERGQMMQEYWKSGSCFAKKRTSWKRGLKRGRSHQGLCGRCEGNRKRTARDDFPYTPGFSETFV